VGEDVPGKLVEETPTLTEKQKDKILFENALDFLGLPADFFKKEERQQSVSESSKPTFDSVMTGEAIQAL